MAECKWGDAEISLGTFLKGEMYSTLRINQLVLL